MTVFVNYYTCSYGDSFVNMFNGEPVQRIGNLAKCQYHEFVEPDFYTGSPIWQKEKLKQFQRLSKPAVSCHRQYQFDFTKVFDEDISVITIILDELDFLPARFKHIHLDSRKKVIKHPTLQKLLDRYPDRYQEIVLADYQNWVNKNCLDTDIKFYFSWINDGSKISKFCNEHQLKFNQNWLDDIINNKQQYVM
jgi:hypothetical protein